jgi:non-heme chloroperoxidase
MRRFARILIGVAVLLGAFLAGVVAFDAPKMPPMQASIAEPFKAVDFSDLPAPSFFTARDGAQLAYRVYKGDPDRLVVLIHGSSGSGADLHGAAKALAAAGATVVTPDERGHGRSGPHGDIAYIGQLEDDLQDLLGTLAKTHQAAETTLIGFSSGGGFALRVAGGPLGPRFQRVILLAPYLRYDAPNARPMGGGWTNVAVPRIVALSLLNGAGMSWFNNLPVVAFAVGAENPHHLTARYSYRLLVNFQPDSDYLGDLRRYQGKLMAVAGADDEIFRSDKLQAALAVARPGVQVDVVPGVGHIGLVTSPAGIAAIVAAWTGK